MNTDRVGQKTPKHLDFHQNALVFLLKIDF